jgi:hypothetical protein
MEQEDRFSRNVRKMSELLRGIHYHFTGDMFTIYNGATTIRIWPLSNGAVWAECLYGEFDDAFKRVHPDPSTECDAIPCACVEAIIYVKQRYKIHSTAALQ